MVFKSGILCAAALTCLAMDPSLPSVAVGAADGVLRMFDLSTPACRQTQVLFSSSLSGCCARSPCEYLLALRKQGGMRFCFWVFPFHASTSDGAVQRAS